MSTNLEYIEQEKDREKEKVGGRLAKLNEKKDERNLEWEIKSKGDIFLLEEQHENLVAVVRKWEKQAATNVRRKWAAVKKEVNGNTYDISSIKKFVEVSGCSLAKQRQEMYNKSALHVQSCFLC